MRERVGHPPAPVFTHQKISLFKQHRTRPCTKRKSGAPAYVLCRRFQGPGPPPTPLNIVQQDVPPLAVRTPYNFSLVFSPTQRWEAEEIIFDTKRTGIAYSGDSDFAALYPLQDFQHCTPMTGLVLIL